ncbi:SDR family oxidoreductase [Methylococcus sp. EFPC2]|uniref:SDR family oxidoreductase n=1 Tax=Methylococcus sp. EFPC2 TaxID=2812648 RepID=UPI00196788EB|nr:SDR family oxidoreductase [Methylococcus sp. EFPC2]QSA95698.1 SDR family oxidoreductase [Methylococcus sp. EFPC2]
MSTYFITGATGVVGSALVPVLLENPGHSVSLLIRAESSARLHQRLDDLFAYWNWGHDKHDLRARVHPIAGDVCLPRFGISPDNYAELARACTHIVHCAGKVQMNLPLEEARASAIDSARNVVDLARASMVNGQFNKVEFVSTIGVSGRMGGLVPETWITKPRRFHNSYEQAKAEAELYIQDQADRGLRVTVHRPSMVVGNSVTGEIIHFQVFYHLCEFLSGKRTFGVFPHLGESCLDVIPADIVARAIAWASKCEETSGRILHLCSGPTGSIRLTDLRTQVRAAFQEYGETLPFLSLGLPTGVFRASLPILRMLASDKMKRALNALPIFLDYLAESQQFENENSKALLSGAGIEIPAINSYLDKMLSFYLSNRRPASGAHTG